MLEPGLFLIHNIYIFNEHETAQVSCIHTLISHRLYYRHAALMIPEVPFVKVSIDDGIPHIGIDIRPPGIRQCSISGKVPNIKVWGNLLGKSWGVFGLEYCRSGVEVYVV